jgi:hypothetical protein
VEGIKRTFLAALPGMLAERKQEKISLTVRRAELEEMVERVVIKVLEQQSHAAAGSLEIKSISTRELCHELGISRQTLNSWYKDPDKKSLLGHCRSKKGGP